MKSIKETQVRRNVLMNMLLTMSSFIFPLITFPYVSRILGPEGTGKVSLATSFISYFSLFAQLGIPTYGVRCCARARDNREELSRVAHELLSVNLVMNLAVYLVLGLTICCVPRIREEKSLYIILSFTIILQSVGMEWLYKGLEQYTYITVRSLIFKLIALAGMFLLVHQADDYVIYGGITIFAASASNILNLVNARKYISLHPVGGCHPLRHLKPVLIFFALACAATIYTHLDTVMLGFMTTNTDVGYYDASVKIKRIAIGLVTSVGTVLLPRASYYIERGLTEEFRKIGAKALEFIFVAAPPLVVYFILYAGQAIDLLSGPAYAGAVLPMRIIMPTVLFIGLTNILGIQILVPLGKEKTVLRSTIAGAVTDLILNAILIPRYASAGAAAGTLAAEFVVLCWQYAALRDQVRPIFLKARYLSISLSLLAAAGVSLLLSRLELNSFGILAVTGISFFPVYFFLLVLMNEPLCAEAIRQVTGRIRHRN